MDNFLSCISNETRLHIIICLDKFQKKNVSELLVSCNISQSALSQHLQILKKCGIVSSKKSGKNNIYNLKDKKIVPISKMLLRELAKRNL